MSAIKQALIVDAVHQSMAIETVRLTVSGLVTNGESLDNTMGPFSNVFAFVTRVGGKVELHYPASKKVPLVMDGREVKGAFTMAPVGMSRWEIKKIDLSTADKAHESILETSNTNFGDYFDKDSMEFVLVNDPPIGAIEFVMIYREKTAESVKSTAHETAMNTAPAEEKGTVKGAKIIK